MFLIIQSLILILTACLLIVIQQVAANQQQYNINSSFEECSAPIQPMQNAPLQFNIDQLCQSFCEQYYNLNSLLTYSIKELNDEEGTLCCCRFLDNPQETTSTSSVKSRSLDANAYNYHYQPGEHFGASEKLEAPVGFGFGRPAHGPGVDLVALNRRRFEHEHRHKGSLNGQNEIKRSELIESNIANIPERLLSNLPDDVNKQIFESLSTDPTLMMGPATMLLPDGDNPDDPDGASVERLTKSCLTVHASSSKPEQLNVTFHLYTKRNPTIPFIIRPQTSRLEIIKNSPFQATRPIKWITHGFHTNVDKSEWMLEAKDKILAFEDANVILTDWRRGASPTLAFYPKAAANAHVVAKLVVKILRRLKNDIDFSKVHLIGHSLGAHIMGFVGSAFTEEFLHQQQQQLMSRSTLTQAGVKHQFWQEQPSPANQLIGRITACDPALPCFGPTSSSPASQVVTQPPAILTTTTINSDMMPVEGRIGPEGVVWPQTTTSAPPPMIDWTPTMWTHLRPDSAIVVEVMHSNPGVMGYSEPLGDFDFYPNGFEKQPGCGQPKGEQSSTMSRQMVTSSRGKRQLGFMSNIFGSLGRSRQSSEQQSSSGPISSTLDRFIKPIRDFFHGYTCSHHRSVEYMVESMYYERVPQDRKLDRDFVCQMVGYRCSDYQSFKRGFCFKCPTELDCRAFTASATPITTFATQQQQQQQQSSSRSLYQAQNLGHQSRDSVFAKRAIKKPESEGFYGINKFISPQVNTNTSIDNNYLNSSDTNQRKKRVLPTYNHFNQHYLPQKRNHYYFDTKPFKNFCLNHYHLLIKYRWFRVRESVTVEGLHIIGTLANITIVAGSKDQSQGQQSSGQTSGYITLNRYSYQTYTMLLTDSIFLGQIEALIIVGDRLKSSLVEYVELSYLSNLDPRIRALGSARLCRSQSPPVTDSPSFLQFVGDKQAPGSGLGSRPTEESLFVRCSGVMV